MDDDLNYYLYKILFGFALNIYGIYRLIKNQFGIFFFNKTFSDRFERNKFILDDPQKHIQKYGGKHQVWRIIPNFVPFFRQKNFQGFTQKYLADRIIQSRKTQHNEEQMFIPFKTLQKFSGKIVTKDRQYPVNCHCEDTSTQINMKMLKQYLQKENFEDEKPPCFITGKLKYNSISEDFDMKVETITNKFSTFKYLKNNRYGIERIKRLKGNIHGILSLCIGSAFIYNSFFKIKPTFEPNYD